MVEYELPKLDTWVRFPSLAPFCFAIRQGKRWYGFAGIFILLLTFSGCKTVPTAPYEYNAVSANIGGVYHYVKPGDTLWSISKLYDVDINALISANSLDDSRDIRRGQRLLIPGAVKKPEAQVRSFSKEFFSWPLKGSVVSYYGSKMDRARNKGIDIHADEGSSVRASRAGKVVFCDEWLKGFGKTIILDHGDNFQTVYAYNSILLVRPGDSVEQNGVIAKVGRGGRAKEPSLHFEIRRNGEPQNPFYYLSR
jgi:murein DD-endopeptidase MepM/ murein hydrolase activator NlpD